MIIYKSQTKYVLYFIKATGAVVESGVLTLTYAVIKDTVCLPALTVTRLIHNYTVSEITSVIHLIQVSYPVGKWL